MICGPAEMDDYVLDFLKGEFQLEYTLYPERVIEYQNLFAQLFGEVVQQGVPVERLTPRLRFNEERPLVKNAEASLLIVLNVFSSLTRRVSKITWDNEYAFGNWLLRTNNAVGLYVESLLLRSLGFLDLSDCWLNSRNLWSANFEGSDLSRVNFVASDCRYVNFFGAKLFETNFAYASLNGSAFRGAQMFGTVLTALSLSRLDLSSVDVEFEEFELTACFRDVEMLNAKFDESDLRNAIFAGATLRNASFKNAVLIGADFSNADLADTDFTGAHLKGANFSGARLDRAKFPREYKPKIQSNKIKLD
jgi:uncharacterized protein YjbI with pentapeptide repeats